MPPLAEHVIDFDNQVLPDRDNSNISETDDVISPRSTTSGMLNPNEADGAQPSRQSVSSQKEHRPSLQPPEDPEDNEVERDGILLDKILEEKSSPHVFPSAHLSVWMRTIEGDEYTGPSSGISTISGLGIDWIRQHVSNSEVLCSSILDIRSSVLGHLRHPTCITQASDSTSGATPTLKPIISSDVAQYVDAYFSRAQTLVPILDRDRFVGQVAEYGIDPTGATDSWNMLLNAVLASGCRAALSDETSEAFQVSGREAWGYFQNAMFYHTRMLNVSQELLAVQGLTVMTVFAQGMSSPQRLEFMLSSAATRMAQSLALHHCPPPQWELSEGEQRERSRLFWTVYCLDKTIALRCGRPAVLRDLDISCPFPHREVMILSAEHGVGLTEHVHELDVLLCAVKLARICGMISERLYSAQGLHLPASELQRTAINIVNRLDAWRKSLPPNMQPGKPFGKIRGLTSSSQMQLLVMHSTYYYLLCAIYRRFSPMFTHDGKDSRHLISHSTEITHMGAAKSIILLTKFFDIESQTPGWLLFYYPFTALTTLFLHVVENPSDPSVRDDIALMEIVVGFFGRLEYITSGEAAFTKTTEFVSQARTIVTRASINAAPQQRPDSNPEYSRNTQRNSEPTMVSPLASWANRAGTIPETGTEDQTSAQDPPQPVSADAHSPRQLEKALHIQELHQHGISSSFSPNLANSHNLRAEEMLDDSWLEDWMISAEHVPVVL
ncbi:hypothetical protein FOVG_16667 [Fusarium oxysporum f. sp. pisi HDV247]|uniref:Xylanolytic transcriptional activator regulatory domain-containing protein n=1 Tax=Fusarium oxysporum f. sp. pisi HDV247 TaxID=1080344 RepID=W9NWF7_FUSOX|nr:hypothetical protein FOVG_16667 [Fusarium oxysporum f. sp. pisi HDV247]